MLYRYPFLKPISSQVFYEEFFAAHRTDGNKNGEAGEQDLYSESKFEEGTEEEDDPMEISKDILLLFVNVYTTNLPSIIK